MKDSVVEYAGQKDLFRETKMEIRASPLNYNPDFS